MFNQICQYLHQTSKFPPFFHARSLLCLQLLLQFFPFLIRRLLIHRIYRRLPFGGCFLFFRFHWDGKIGLIWRKLIIKKVSRKLSGYDITLLAGGLHCTPSLSPGSPFLSPPILPPILLLILPPAFIYMYIEKNISQHVKQSRV